MASLCCDSNGLKRILVVIGEKREAQPIEGREGVTSSGCTVRVARVEDYVAAQRGGIAGAAGALHETGGCGNVEKVHSGSGG